MHGYTVESKRDGNGYVLLDPSGDYLSVIDIREPGENGSRWFYLLSYVPQGWAHRCIWQGLQLCPGGRDVIEYAAARGREIASK